ncbi:MAG TPA: hypothetical protein VK506_12475 [Conexibacter sp.]|nr:hypothetical protein [Conexibacter sp.]
MDAPVVAQLVTAGAAVVALGAAVWQLRSTRRQAREAATHAYIARLTEAEFTKHLARSMDALRLGEHPTEHEIEVRWRRFARLKHEQQIEIAAPFNMFESVAGLYNRNLVTRGIIEHQLENTAIVVFQRIEWWVTASRTRNRGYFREWELMLGWFAERRLRAAWHTSRP